MHLAVAVRAVAQHQAAALQAGGKSALKGLGLAVGDVQHRRHAVAIGGAETARREIDLSHHVGVDDTHTLLLTRADELRTIDLDAVDIDAVLVVGTAAHHILRTHLVLGADTRHRGQHRFDTAARGIGRAAQHVHVDALHRGGLFLVFGNLYLSQFQRFLIKFRVDGHRALRLNELAGHRRVAQTGKFHHQGIGLGDRHLILALGVGVGAHSGAQQSHRGKLDGLAGGIDDFTGDFDLRKCDCGAQQAHHNHQYAGMESH